MVSHEPAYANFDFDHYVPNYARWEEINAKVLGRNLLPSWNEILLGSWTVR
jgi:hypothetical protein